MRGRAWCTKVLFQGYVVPLRYCGVVCPQSVPPQTYRPPTPPIPSARRPMSYVAPSQLESQTSLTHPFRMVSFFCFLLPPVVCRLCARLPFVRLFQIYPDPPSVIMQDSNQTLRRCSAPSLCLSESTRLPPSVNTRPSVHSVSSSSDGHTAVSFHAGMGSWYLPDDLQAEWDHGLQNEKKAAIGRKGADGQTDLPMHHVSASRLRKTTKRRSCSGVLWGAVTSFGRGIMFLFDTKPMETGPTAS